MDASPEPDSIPPHSNVPPPQPPPLDPLPGAPSGSSSGLQPNLAAALASFFSIAGGVVFLVLEKRDSFVRFYAMQAILLGGVSLAIMIGIQIAAAILIHLPLLGWLLAILLWLVGFVAGMLFFALWVITTIKAFTGKEWEIPYLGPIARKQLADMGTGVEK